MQLIIAGSRSFHDYQRLCQTRAPERHRITQVLTGGARGADQLGYRWAWKHQVTEDVSEVLGCYSLRVYESPSNLQSNRVTS